MRWVHANAFEAGCTYIAGCTRPAASCIAQYVPSIIMHYPVPNAHASLINPLFIYTLYINCITHAHALSRAQRTNKNSSDRNALYTIRGVRCCLRMRTHNKI